MERWEAGWLQLASKIGKIKGTAERYQLASRTVRSLVERAGLATTPEIIDALGGRPDVAWLDTQIRGFDNAYEDLAEAMRLDEAMDQFRRGRVIAAVRYFSTAQRDGDLETVVYETLHATGDFAYVWSFIGDA